MNSFAQRCCQRLPVPGTFPVPMVPEQWTEGPAGVHLHTRTFIHIHMHKTSYNSGIEITSLSLSPSLSVNSTITVKIVE